MKPSTPLPWTAYALTVNGDSLEVCEVADHVHADHDNSADAPQNAAYIAHACNAYPRLVEALRSTLGKLADHATRQDDPQYIYAATKHHDDVLALLRSFGEDA